MNIALTNVDKPVNFMTIIDLKEKFLQLEKIQNENIKKDSLLIF
jgi:hypothetical protein